VCGPNSVNKSLRRTPKPVDSWYPPCGRPSPGARERLCQRLAIDQIEMDEFSGRRVKLDVCPPRIRRSLEINNVRNRMTSSLTEAAALTGTAAPSGMRLQTRADARQSTYSDRRCLALRSNVTTRLKTLTALLFGLTLSSGNTASASDTLELIPDYALFGLILGEPGFGSLWIMLIGFVVLIFPLNVLIYQPIFRALDERADRISGARKRSAQLESEADEVLDRYETAIREARTESEAKRQDQLTGAREEQLSLTTQARSESEADLVRARSELGTSLEEARASLRAGAEDLAKAAAEQVLGRTLS
jgi:F-type H+-transporting ATPase subunit b